MKCFLTCAIRTASIEKPKYSNYKIPTCSDRMFPSSKQRFQLQIFWNKFRHLAIQSQGGEATHPPVLDRHCLETMPSSPNNTCGTLDSEQ
jgi:hypothetical protein